MYVFLALAKCHFAITSFDMWMSKGTYDGFALIFNCLGNDWQPKHVTIGLFEVIETISQALAINLIELLEKYGLRKKIITYVKVEGSNLKLNVYIKSIQVDLQKCIT
jgi:hypothetical protein